MTEVTVERAALEAGETRGRRRRILVFATQGAGGNDESRIRELLSSFDVEVFPFDRAKRWRSMWQLSSKLAAEKPELVVMEGSGVAGGAALLLRRLTHRTRYVLSSGDAFGPFLAARMPLGRVIFNLYERLLCSYSAGFIGWSPYLVGRALTFGAPRACTAAGWAPSYWTREELAEGRRRVRRQMGISESATVYGIAGALIWNPRVKYCYGLELVAARKLVSGDDVKVLIMGDGPGRRYLEDLAGDQLGRDVFLTGQVDREQLPAYLAALDVASLPQTLDQVGSFRYTTKLSEYKAVGLPVLCGQLPVAYDLDEGGYWRIAGKNPWQSTYIAEIARMMANTSLEEIGEMSRRVQHRPECFDRDKQRRRVTTLINDLLEAIPA